VVHDDSDDPGTKPSPHFSTSPRSHRAGQSYLPTPSGEDTQPLKLTFRPTCISCLSKSVGLEVLFAIFC